MRTVTYLVIAGAFALALCWLLVRDEIRVRRRPKVKLHPRDVHSLVLRGDVPVPPPDSYEGCAILSGGVSNVPDGTPLYFADRERLWSFIDKPAPDPMEYPSAVGW
jgi:hypothetical protein